MLPFTAPPPPHPSPTSPSPQPSTSLLLSSAKENPSDVAGKALVAAWLQTGSIYQVMKLIVRGEEAKRRSFYHSGSAMLDPKTMANAVHCLKRLNEVEIKVDTTSVVAEDDEEEDPSASSAGNSLNFVDANQESNGTPPRRNFSAGSPGRFSSDPPAPSVMKRVSSEGSQSHHHHHRKSSSIIGNFARNVVFEVKDTAKKVNPFKRKSNSRLSTTESLLSTLPSATSTSDQGGDNDQPFYSHHQDAPSSGPLHNNNYEAPPSPPPTSSSSVNQLMYHHNSVVATRLRLARAKGLEAWSKKVASNHNLTLNIRPGMESMHAAARVTQRHTARFTSKPLTLTMVGPARSLEIPDEDNSLLFSARPRRIRPIGVHNDVNPSNNFITFVATYREVIPPSSFGEMTKARGGVMVWRCRLHYYPSDRSARVEDPKWEDER